MWYHEFNAYFWLTLATVLGAGITMLTKAALKSNCTHVRLCCFECRRDTTHNIAELELAEQSAGPNTSRV